jgi:hypothetical protein
MDDDSTVILVGGTFDENGGKKSSVFGEFARGFMDRAMLENSRVAALYKNGGNLQSIYEHDLCKGADVVVWMAHIPDEAEVDRKAIHSVKMQAPHATLVMSKAVYDRDPVPNYADITQKMLAARANLLLRISAMDFAAGKTDRRYHGLLIDPLGNQWGEETTAFDELGKRAASIVYQNIRSLTRVRSVNVARIARRLSGNDVPEDFLTLVRENGKIFSTLKPRTTEEPKDEKERFFGNAAFRCNRGFPAYRGRHYIFVSRRNVEKDTIGPDDFVPVEPFQPYSDGVRYYGSAKPSVDTPIQLRLFDALPKIRFMMHGHVYLTDDVPMTEHVLPCGALEEFEEVMNALKWRRDTTSFGVNLKGHGFIAGSDYVGGLPRHNSAFRERPVPEQVW